MSTNPTRPDTPVQFNLARVFETLAETLGDQECFVWRERRLSYAQLAERARRLASYLHGRGLGIHTQRDRLAGHESGQDHVALALYNGNEYLEGMLGAFGARLAPFNVNYRYVGEELRYLLDDAGPRALIFHASLAPTLAQVLPTLKTPPDVLLQVADQSDNDLLPGAVDYEEALAASSPSGPPVDPSPDDLYILYTGGTTGMPKGVLWRQHDIFMGAMGGRSLGSWESVTSYEGITERLKAASPLRMLLLPPLMHGAAQWAVFMTMAQGSAIILPDDPRRLDPDDVWRTVEREKANITTVVGDAVLRPLVMQLDKAQYDLSSFFAVGNGGGAVDPGGARAGEGPYPQPVHIRRRRLLGDRGPDARVPRGPGGYLRPRSRHGGDRRRVDPGAAAGTRRRRVAGPGGLCAARLSGRRREDRPHLPHYRRDSVLGPGRPGPASGRRRNPAPRA